MKYIVCQFSADIGIAADDIGQPGIFDLLDLLRRQYQFIPSHLRCAIFFVATLIG
jgi:hypothetical protein